MNIQQPSANINTVTPLTSAPKMNTSSKLGISDSLATLGSQVRGSTEVREFMGEMKQAMHNGTFDAATFAETAPQALKDIAANEGVDLKKEFQKMQEHFSQRKTGSVPTNISVDTYQALKSQSQIANAGQISLSA
ncbi:hypothetical protein [Thalassotalea fusca]